LNDKVWEKLISSE